MIELTLHQSDDERFCDETAVTNNEQGQRNGDDERRQMMTAKEASRRD